MPMYSHPLSGVVYWEFEGLRYDRVRGIVNCPIIIEKQFGSKLFLGW